MNRMQNIGWRYYAYMVGGMATIYIASNLVYKAGCWRGVLATKKFVLECFDDCLEEYLQELES